MLADISACILWRTRGNLRPQLKWHRAIYHMYMHIFIYIYIYVHLYMNVYRYVNISKCIHVFVYIIHTYAHSDSQYPSSADIYVYICCPMVRGEGGMFVSAWHVARGTAGRWLRSIQRLSATPGTNYEHEEYTSICMSIISYFALFLLGYQVLVGINVAIVSASVSHRVVFSCLTASFRLRV